MDSSDYFCAIRPAAEAEPPQEWFKVSAFQQLQPDPLGRLQVFGDEGPNIVQRPGWVNWDFSAFRSFHVTESKEFQFPGALFNILNDTNFRLRVTDISSPNFEQIQQDAGPGVIQVG